MTIDVPQPLEEVYDFLDVLANHEAFTDHMLVDWECSGPAAGVGAKVHVKSKAAGRTEDVEIEVVEGERPRRIVERNVSAKGKRIGTGTYLLVQLPDGGTHITFEYAWQQAPLSDRLGAPVVRSVLRRGNQRALQRLADLLAARTA